MKHYGIYGRHKARPGPLKLIITHDLRCDTGADMMGIQPGTALCGVSIEFVEVDDRVRMTPKVLDWVRERVLTRLLGKVGPRLQGYLDQCDPRT